jgi:hypothetical protein
LNVDPWNALRLTSRRCFTLMVFAAAIPAWWEISTMTEPCFNHLRITLPPSNLTCHLMASKRQSIVVWCGGTEIPAASNLSIEGATPAQRTAQPEPWARLVAMRQYRLTLRCRRSHLRSAGRRTPVADAPPVPNLDCEILNPFSGTQLRDQPARLLATTGPSLGRFFRIAVFWRYRRIRTTP